MAFDINEVVADMTAAIKKTVKENWAEMKDAANSFLQARKARLELLATLLLEKEISRQFFDKQLEGEKKILESEFNAMVVITKAMAQKAANAAIDVLSNAVSKLITIK